MLALCLVVAAGNWASDVALAANGTSPCVNAAACATACVARARSQTLCDHPTGCTQYHWIDRAESTSDYAIAGRGEKRCLCGWPEPVTYSACVEYDTRNLDHRNAVADRVSANIFISIMVLIAIATVCCGVYCMCNEAARYAAKAEDERSARAARYAANPAFAGSVDLVDDGLGWDE
jgi:hypothetical protein